jgi:hypothetical protein
MALYNFNCWQEITISCNKYCAIDLTRRRKFHHIDAKKDVDPLLREYWGTIVFDSAVFELAQPYLKAGQSRQSRHVPFASSEAGSFFRRRRAALIWQAMVVVGA